MCSSIPIVSLCVPPQTYVGRTKADELLIDLNVCLNCLSMVHLLERQV